MPAARSKLRSWRLAVPLGLFLVIAAAWTGLWLVAKSRVEQAVDTWLASEANAGRAHQCLERGVNGFPFRIDVSCARPVFQVETPEGPVLARASAAIATALVYRPNHILVELRPPFVIERAGSEVAAVDFDRAQASYRIAQGAFERFSLVLERPRFARASETRPEFGAERIEVHTRQSPGGPPGERRDFDLAFSGQGLAPPGARPEQAADIETNWLVAGVPITRGGGSLADWARSGGAVQVTGLRVKRGEGLLSATGQLGFNAAGAPEGAFEANLADPQSLFRGLVLPGVGDVAALIGPALALMGRPSEFEGRRVTHVRLNVEDGRVSIGRVTLARLPPLF